MSLDENLTPDGYKADPKNLDAILEMKPPQNLQDLQLSWLSKLS